MSIRKASLSDSESIAHLFMLAMNFLVYSYIGEENYDKAIDFLLHFIQQKKTQLSYENCYVSVKDKNIIGVINCYDGANLRRLRQPILDHIHQYTDSEFHIEDETQAGEIYIDVLAVSESQRGKGIGSKLIKHVIDDVCFKNRQTMGLLVDTQNPNAKRLYLQLGFKKMGEKKLSGHNMEHLQFKI